ncbi:Uncharacterised protein [Mycobacteroides abscessus subsp. abscessus]|uniref:hypothetical protein n=1 Tax=Mycobacteroides abscessus TaxID=36809 RepID=UPI0009280E26|nr:hypothetical protein [Mycobacteroides abscessus]SIE09091.1 Uncharacterised protein [Mycobacteroides abscessus subsp. abscessus]SIG00009.1 Uncharacterised protein [Mycobacteroides abscessus subsp. abscessus]SIG17362.1 Uncharacterised protein [Mycobacteroides abscessus subsp. abscessus]SIG50473.1 Uncharacterised protein [Mycobacteroides abscessus subsp. abscessus]SII32137.1 Uncharacterised protein [Mycobacteroides abscessus subsp. abscessus]
MEPIPVAKNPKIPTSQQQAQNTVLKYLQDTLNALPPGSTLDGTRYAGAGILGCDDNATSHSSSIEYENWRDVVLPAGTDFNTIINQVGELWKSWGWQVIERNDFDKPNRFGYAPDGYGLQIESRNAVKAAPSLIGGSPCFSGDLEDKDLPVLPLVLTQTAAS